MHTIPLEQRFWSRVQKAGPDDCWLWKGELNNMGYGVFYTYAKDRRKKHYAHRMSMRLAGTLVEDLFALHSCDTPRCVNPAHLRPGTQAENYKDAADRGRADTSGLALRWVHRAKHGTASMYNRGCRTDESCPRGTGGISCRDAHRAYMVEWRANRKLRRERAA